MAPIHKPWAFTASGACFGEGSPRHPYRQIRDIRRRRGVGCICALRSSWIASRALTSKATGSAKVGGSDRSAGDLLFEKRRRYVRGTRCRRQKKLVKCTGARKKSKSCVAAALKAAKKKAAKKKAAPRRR